MDEVIKSGENAIEIIEKLVQLSDKQMSVLYWKCRGITNQEIADEVLDEKTVRAVSSHMSEVYGTFDDIEWDGKNDASRTKEIKFKEYVCGVVKAVIKDQEDLKRWNFIRADLVDQLEKHKTEDEPVIFIPEEEPVEEVIQEPVIENEETEEESERPWYIDEDTGQNLVDVAIGTGEFLDEIFSKLELVEGSVERVEKSVDEIKESVVYKSKFPGSPENAFGIILIVLFIMFICNLTFFTMYMLDNLNF